MLQQHFRLTNVTCGEDTTVYYLANALSKYGVIPYVAAEDINVDKKAIEGFNLIKVGRPYSLRSYIKKFSLDRQLDFTIIHSHEVQRAYLFSLLKSQKQPLIVHYHNPLTSLPLRSGRSMKVFNGCDKIFVPSTFVANKLSKVCSIPAGKIEVIHNGVDIKRFRHILSSELNTKYGIPKDAKIVLFVGRISSIKGLLTLVKAIPLVLRFLPSIYFVFVGSYLSSDSVFQELTEIIKSLGIKERCIFTGFVPHSDLPYIISSANILVLPSLIEAFGTVALEAMACETPVIAARVGGLPEIITPKVGVLFSPKDPAELSGAIIQLLSDEKNARNMGRNGRSWVKQNFTWDTIAQKVKQCYEAVLT